MDNPNYTIEHKKGQHLTSEERHEIEVRLKDGWTIYRIAMHLGRPYNTIKNEVKRGTVLLYGGKVKRYKADVGEAVYQEHRQSSRRKFRTLETSDFLRYVVKQFREQGWSLDACVGYARKTGLFPADKMVCTKTLYNYVDLGLLPIKNIDLPEKLTRNTKPQKVRENRKKLGKSIEERPEHINSRKEFGHWEIDSVLGTRDKNEPAVMTIVERKCRMSLWIKVADHSAETVNKALSKVFKQFGRKYTEVFKTITGDNGSEFADLAQMEKDGIDVYFTHPFSSFEKGTNERHNRMLRRFIPKGKRISDYSAEDILFFGDIVNDLPRKILGYYTPEELFEQELDRIYAA